VPTETPLPSPTPLTCPGGYDMYTHLSLGFKACHPTGWTVSEQDDPEEAARWVTFSAPTSNRDTGEGLKLIAVRVSPNTTGKTGDEFLAASAVSLINEFSDWLIEWPYLVQIGDRDGVEVNYQMGLLFQPGRVMVVGWKAYLLGGDQQWLIQAVGRTEYRNELAGIHDEFLVHFLPPG
jgi:hypothetical protein